MFTLPLSKDLFQKEKKTLIASNDFEINTFIYPSGIEALEIKNAKGHLVVLPFMGQMIWDAVFLQTDLCMKNMFREPKPAKTIVETYGCFAFHAGMLSMGCPSQQDSHPLHGEMPCAVMDSAWLEISENQVSIYGTYEYVMGFGDHYLAQPSVCLAKDASVFDINMKIKNLASVDMPLQYMCHINSAYVENAIIKQNIPDSAITLRESIPAHVMPTTQWLDYNETLKTAPPIEALTTPEMYSPEIVYFMDNLSHYGEKASFQMDIGDHYLLTEFSTAEFDSATRWILYNGDQQVAAYALPATCRPEGFLSAKTKGTLLYLAPNEVRHFSVRTGICEK